VASEARVSPQRTCRRGALDARRGAWVMSYRRCGSGGSTGMLGQHRAASQVVCAYARRVAMAKRAMRAPLARSALA